MQLGGSLIVTLTVPIPETILLEPPLQLTMIPAIANIATTASKTAPARGFRAIHSEFMVLLLLKKNFSNRFCRKGTEVPAGFQALAGLLRTQRAGRSQRAEL